jgi:hypothetical protein
LPFGQTRFGAGKFFARATNYRSTVAPLAPRRSLQTRWRASRRAISPPLASRYRRRGTLPAQIPIAELAARPTEAYCPRFRALALFRRRPPSMWLDRRCRHPKTFTKADIAASLMSNACEGVRSRTLSQKLPNLREKLTRAIRLRYEIIAARRSGFLFISAQGIRRDRDNWYRTKGWVRLDASRDAAAARS